MNAQQLRELQTPLKEKYREHPDTARLTLQVTGQLDPDNIVCHIESPGGPVHAGLHPATGGDGSWACSGDMLLEALVACAGVTLKAVATALEIPVRGGTITAAGDLDFRGTLGVAKDVPVGFESLRMTFRLDTDAEQEQLDKLVRLTERYCVVLQTLVAPVSCEVECLAKQG